MKKKSFPKRKPTRLKEYDYSLQGYYFITVCVENFRQVLGKVEDEKMILNTAGKIVEDTWKDIPKHYERCELDEFVVMPNHFHSIIILENVSRDRSQTDPKKVYHKHSLSEIVRAFESFSSREINKQSSLTQKFKWQKSFFDRVIRNERELFLIRKYIQQNPLKWNIEKNNPGNIKSDFLM